MFTGLQIFRRTCKNLLTKYACKVRTKIGNFICECVSRIQFDICIAIVTAKVAAFVAPPSPNADFDSIRGEINKKRFNKFSKA